MRVERKFAASLNNPKLSIFTQANVMFQVDAAHAGDDYYAFLYVEPNGTWKYQVKRYPMDDVYVVLHTQTILGYFGKYDRYNDADLSSFYSSKPVGTEFTNRIANELQKQKQIKLIA